jgi:hypothetical protein
MKYINANRDSFMQSVRHLQLKTVLVLTKCFKFKLSLMVCSCIVLAACSESSSQGEHQAESSSNSKSSNSTSTSNSSSPTLKQTEQHEHHVSTQSLQSDFSGIKPAMKEQANQAHNDLEILTVYKSPTCGCCHKWIEHIANNGMQIKAVDSDNLSNLKARFGIATHIQSCHTAVSNAGYVFEGHVPAKFIKKFLQSPPEDAKGLTVPAMPLGSPGMEVGDRFMPYQILLILNDGSTSEYVAVNAYEEQF